MDLWTVALVSDDNVDIFGSHVFGTEAAAKYFADRQPEGVYTLCEAQRLPAGTAELWTVTYVSDTNVDIFGTRVFGTAAAARCDADNHPEGVFAVYQAHALPLAS